jgi:hypothetical protein
MCFSKSFLLIRTSRLYLSVNERFSDPLNLQSQICEEEFIAIECKFSGRYFSPVSELGTFSFLIDMNTETAIQEIKGGVTIMNGEK